MEITRAQIKKRKEHLDKFLLVSPEKENSISLRHSEIVMPDEKVLELAFPKLM